MKTTKNFIILILIIEFFDEWVFGLREAALPLIRDDLNLSYVQIGVLATVPTWVSIVTEPLLGIWGDLGKRRLLVLGGGVVYGLMLFLLAISGNFLMALLAFALIYPASGAFVSLAQATLMDIEPTRHEHNMARWTLAGSVGMVLGPITLSVLLWLGGDWRLGFGVLGFVALIVAGLGRRFGANDFQPPVANGDDDDEGETTPLTFRDGIRLAGLALRRRVVLRWLALLQLSDLMLDVLFGFIALYFVDVVGVSTAQAAIAVSVWTGLGLVGDALLIPLLERVPSLRYLRWSVVAQLALFPAFLLIDPFVVKVGLLGLLGMLNAGWYAILKGQLYSTMRGQSGMVLTVENIASVFSSLLPLVLGIIADTWGLEVMMWCLLIAPIALLVGLPRHAPSVPLAED